MLLRRGREVRKDVGTGKGWEAGCGEERQGGEKCEVVKANGKERNVW